jgi:uncharacterized membrane protein YheB (UPF0754 family)
VRRQAVTGRREPPAEIRKNDATRWLPFSHGVPETMQEAKDYTAKTLDIENLIVEKMNKLSPDQYESILRPVFKDDEMLMVTLGAVLGFLVGELQVVLVEQFAR